MEVEIFSMEKTWNPQEPTDLASLPTLPTKTLRVFVMALLNQPLPPEIAGVPSYIIRAYDILI